MAECPSAPHDNRTQGVRRSHERRKEVVRLRGCKRCIKADDKRVAKAHSGEKPDLVRGRGEYAWT